MLPSLSSTKVEASRNDETSTPAASAENQAPNFSISTQHGMRPTKEKGAKGGRETERWGEGGSKGRREEEREGGRESEGEAEAESLSRGQEMENRGPARSVCCKRVAAFTACARADGKHFLNARAILRPGKPETMLRAQVAAGLWGLTGAWKRRLRCGHTRVTNGLAA